MSDCNILGKFLNAFMTVIPIILICFFAFLAFLTGKCKYDDIQDYRSQQSAYEEALELSCEDVEIYIDGFLAHDFDICGIDHNKYTIVISDNKDKIYLKSN